MVLAFCMIITLVFLQGCGTKGNSNETTIGTGSESKAATESTTEKPGEPVILKILTQDNYDPNNSLAKGSPIWSEVERLANVKVEWELAAPGANHQQLVNTRMAAGVDLPDIVAMSTTDDLKVFELAQSGLVIPLDELIEKYAPNWKNIFAAEYPMAKTTRIMPDGKLYSLNYIQDIEARNIWQDIIREDWLNKVGITKLPETIDEYYNALKTMQEKDANGNGKPDEKYCAVGWWQFTTVMPQAFGVVQSKWDVDANGKVYPVWTSAMAKEFMKFANKLYKDGLVDPELVTIPYDKFLARLNGNTVSATSNMALNHKVYFDATVKDVQGVKHSPLVALKGPDGRQNALITDIYATGYHFMITKDCKNPEAAIKFMDFLVSPEGRTLHRYGIKGVHYTEENGKITPTDWKTWGDGSNESEAAAKGAEGLEWISLPHVKKTSLKEDAPLLQMSSEAVASFEASMKVAKQPYRSAIPTEDEMKQINDASKDVWTYMDEMLAKFFMGKESLDNWDQFVQKANDMGLAKLTEIEQARYERFINAK